MIPESSACGCCRRHFSWRVTKASLIQKPAWLLGSVAHCLSVRQRRPTSLDERFSSAKTSLELTQPSQNHIITKTQMQPRYSVILNRFEPKWIGNKWNHFLKSQSNWPRQSLICLRLFDKGSNCTFYAFLDFLLPQKIQPLNFSHLYLSAHQRPSR